MLKCWSVSRDKVKYLQHFRLINALKLYPLNTSSTTQLWPFPHNPLPILLSHSLFYSPTLPHSYISTLTLFMFLLIFFVSCCGCPLFMGFPVLKWQFNTRSLIFWFHLNLFWILYFLIYLGFEIFSDKQSNKNKILNIF